MVWKPGERQARPTSWTARPAESREVRGPADGREVCGPPPEGLGRDDEERSRRLGRGRRGGEVGGSFFTWIAGARRLALAASAVVSSLLSRAWQATAGGYAVGDVRPFESEGRWCGCSTTTDEDDDEDGGEALLRTRLAAGSAPDEGDDCSAEKGRGETIRSRDGPSGVEAGGAATAVDMGLGAERDERVGRARSLVGADERRRAGAPRVQTRRDKTRVKWV